MSKATKNQSARKDQVAQAEREVLESLDHYFTVLAEMVSERRQRAFGHYQEREDLVRRIENDERRMGEITARMDAMSDELSRARLASDYLREAELQSEFSFLSDEMQNLKQRLEVARESLSRDFYGAARDYTEFEEAASKSTLLVLKSRGDRLKRKLDREFPRLRRRVLDANRG